MGGWDVVDYLVDVLSSSTLRQRFRELAADPDKGIGADAYVRTLSDAICAPPPPPPNGIEDGDGYDSAASSLRPPATFGAPPPARDRYAVQCALFGTFSGADANGDGYVSWDDLVQFVIDSRAESCGVQATRDRDSQRSYVVAARLAYNYAAGKALPPVTDGGVVDIAKGRSARATLQAHREERSRANALRHPPQPLPAQGAAVAADGAPSDPHESVPPLRMLRPCASQQRYVGITTGNSIVALDGNLSVVAAACGQQSRCPQAVPWLADMTAQGLLVATHASRYVKVWAAARGAPAPMALPLQFEYVCNAQPTALHVHAAPTAPPGTVLTGEADGGIRLWDLSAAIMAQFRAGDSIDALRRMHADYYSPGDRHSAPVRAFATAADLGANLVVSAGSDGVLAVHDLTRQTLLQSHRLPHGLLALAPTTVAAGTTLVAAAGYCEHPCLWDVRARLARPTPLRDVLRPHFGKVIAVAEARATVGSLPVVASADARGRLKLWDVRMLGCIHTVDLAGELAADAPDEEGDEGPQPLGGSRHRRDVVVDLCGDTAGTDRFLVLGQSALAAVDARSNARPLHAFTSPTVGAVLDKGSSRIYTAHEDAVVVWDGTNGTIINVHRPDLGPLRALDTLGADHPLHWTANAAAAAASANRRPARPWATAPSPRSGALQPETLSAIAVCTRGHQYIAGTSHGRVAAIKKLTGDVAADYGRVLRSAVVCLHIGYLARDVRVIAALGDDGALVSVTTNHAFSGRLTLAGGGRITCFCFAMETAGTVAIGTDDGRVIIATLHERQLPAGNDESVAVEPGAVVAAVALVPTEPLIVAVFDVGVVRIISAVAGTVLSRVAIAEAADRPLLLACALPGPSAGHAPLVAVADDSGGVHVFPLPDTSRGRPIAGDAEPALAMAQRVRTVRLHQQAPHLLTGRYNDTTFISAAPDGSVFVCDANTGEVAGRLCHGRQASDRRPSQILPSMGRPRSGGHANIPPFHCPSAPVHDLRRVQRAFAVMAHIRRFIRILQARVERRRSRTQSHITLLAETIRGQSLGDVLFAPASDDDSSEGSDPLDIHSPASTLAHTQRSQQGAFQIRTNSALERTLSSASTASAHPRGGPALDGTTRIPVRPHGVAPVVPRAAMKVRFAPPVAPPTAPQRPQSAPLRRVPVHSLPQ